MTDAEPVCGACRSPFDPAAVRCAKCGEWRADIKRDRNRYYFWCAFLFVLLLPFLLGLAEGWWAPPLRSRGFDVGVFLASPMGLGLFAAALFGTWRSWHFYATVSRKTGNWAWM